MGHYDLALQEFGDYIRYYGDTAMAVDAQFKIGEIALRQGDTEGALAAFDQVLERDPKGAKAPEALYMKAQVLERQGQHAQAILELDHLVRSYPRSEAAHRGRVELQRLRARPASTASRS